MKFMDIKYSEKAVKQLKKIRKGDIGYPAVSAAGRFIG